MSRGEKKSLTGKHLYTELQDACRGLVYISETDAAITAVLLEGKELSVEDVVKNLASGGPIVKKAPGEFFDKLTKDRDWHGDAERKRVRQFRKIERIVSDNLNDVQLFRVGRIRVAIFVLGCDADGNIAGIRTEAVET